MGGKQWRWGVILDAGSSGTRLHIYRWKDPAKSIKDAPTEELESLPKLQTKKNWTKKIHPGVSTFGQKPTDVGPGHLQPLLDHALDIIPEDKVKDTPIFLMATAGMRLLPQLQQTALTREICAYMRQNTQFSLPDCDLHVQVIKGETEGLYGWIATNYLLGGFDRPDQHQHGNGHHTYGFLDMGGASAQIAFAPNTTEAEKHSDDLKLLRMRTLSGRPMEYKVFTATWLGFGVNQAREKYIKSLSDSFSTQDELPDPCMPRGLRTTLEGEPVTEADSGDLTLVGTGAFGECLRRTYPLLGKEAPCENHPCLLNGQHVPAIDFGVNHFIGVSEYWHTTHGVFGVKDDKGYDFATYQERVLGFCSQDWNDIEKKFEGSDSEELKHAQEACFKASWLINVLHDGIGVPRASVDSFPNQLKNITKGGSKADYDAFRPVDKLDGFEVSWTLGKMVLYAAGQIAPDRGDDSFPVGFGTNVAGVPGDFQLAGSSWQPSQTSHDEDDEDWSDTAEDLLDKASSKPTASGLMMFILILVLFAFVFRKKERRMRFYGRVNTFVRRSRRPGTPRKGGRGGLSGLASRIFGGSSTTYERIVEEGEADHFDLGEADSSDNEHSDSSDGSRMGRTSGLAAPKLNADFYEPTSVSALDRSGLFVRTESRDRLMPGGRRSRGTSPTRLKSPMMTPLQD